MEGQLVLKFATPTDERNEKGNTVYSKYTAIGAVNSAMSKKGKKFLVANDVEGNSYFIASTTKVGPNHPSKVLSVKQKGAEQSELLCGLFRKTYNDGSFSLIGKSRDTGIKYGLFVESEARKEATPATAADL